MFGIKSEACDFDIIFVRSLINDCKVGGFFSNIKLVRMESNCVDPIVRSIVSNNVSI